MSTRSSVDVRRDENSANSLLKRHRKHIPILIAIMVAIAVVASGTSIVSLYDAAFDQSRVMLLEIVKGKASMAQAVTRFDAMNSQDDHPEGAAAATIEQLVDGIREFRGFGESSLITIAWKKGNTVTLYSKSSSSDVVVQRTVPYDDTLPPTVFHALREHSGSSILRDAEGREILAAFDNVPELNAGIIATVEIADIRAPFIHMMLIAGIASIVFILVGAWLVYRLTTPLIHEVASGEAYIRGIMEHAADSIVTINSEGTIESVNPAAAFMFGYETEEMIGRNVSMLMPEPDRSEHDNYIRNYLTTRRGKILGVGARDVFGRRKNGNEFPLELSIGEMEIGRERKFVATMRDITERIADQEALIESEERSRSVIDLSPDAILITIDGVVKFSNPAAARMFGADNALQINGKTFAELTHPDDRDQVTDFVRKNTSDSVSRFAELKRIRLDGSEFESEASSTSLVWNGETARLTFIRDISERKAAEQTSTRLGRILDRSFNEIYVFAADTMKFIQVSKGARQSMGYTMAEMRDLTAFDIDPEITEEMLHELVAPLMNGEREFITFESVHQRRDGTTYPVIVRLQLSREEDPPVFVAIIEDVTERKAAEAALQQANEGLELRVQERTAQLKSSNTELQQTVTALRDAQDQLVESEKMASLGGLVAGVAHEINTPIGVGVTAASHLEDAITGIRERYDAGEMKRSDLEKFLEINAQSTKIVLSNLRRASDLIRSFKQVAVDQSSEEARTIKLHDYINEVLTSLRPQLKKTSHRIEFDCDDALAMDTYPGALSQIVTNFVMNSILHAFEPDDEGHIRISVANGGDSVSLRYSDDGKGMGEEQIARIYEPFFTTKRGSGGSGLGMHIVYNLITRTLGGRIDCTSEPGNGTRFDVTLPLYSENTNVH